MEDKEKVALANYSFETVPAMIFGDKIPLLALLDKFEEISKICMKKANVVNIDINQFTIGKHSFILKEGKPYYVIVFRFPFKEDDEYIDMVKSLYLVGSENLSDICVFSQVLRKNALHANKLYYEVLQIVCNDAMLHYEFLLNSFPKSEEKIAQDCVVFSAFYDKKENKKKNRV